MTRKTIAFFPEASFGAALNCVGIAQALRERGHEAVFLCDPGFAGVFENYGFAEHPVPMAPDMSDEELEKFWSGFITRHLPHFRLSPEDQLPTYVRDCWEAIVDSAEIAEAPLQAAIGRIDPDAIVVDNVIGFPALMQAGVPWAKHIIMVHASGAEAWSREQVLHPSKYQRQPSEIIMAAAGAGAGGSTPKAGSTTGDQVEVSAPRGAGAGGSTPKAGSTTGDQVEGSAPEELGGRHRRFLR